MLHNFRIIDADAAFSGSLLLERGLIKAVIPGGGPLPAADAVIDSGVFGGGAALMPAFIDLHAHFRDSGVNEKDTPFPSETIESAALAAAAGGFGTVVCMANTRPVIDTIEKARSPKTRADSLGVIDLYPVLALTKNMEGRELSGITVLPAASNGTDGFLPLMLSEDGRDIADNGLFLAALTEARRLGLPVSCHCDFGGAEAEAAKAAGSSRAEWSRIEENNAIRRAIELGKQAQCHIHIAHVSTREAADIIRAEKKALVSGMASGFTLTCEAAPHHFGADETDACRMGSESYGRVNPPLRNETDRRALIAAINDGTIDVIATDHAPHSTADKAAGAPGFTGLETAFAAALSYLTPEPAPAPALQRLSALLSANPARILGLDCRTPGRGRIAPGHRADLVIVDVNAQCTVNPELFCSRGKCTPFAGRELKGKVLMTINTGRIVYEGKIE